MRHERSDAHRDGLETVFTASSVKKLRQVGAGRNVCPILVSPRDSRAACHSRLIKETSTLIKKKIPTFFRDHDRAISTRFALT